MIKLTNLTSKFKNRALLEQALTHKSYLNEDVNSKESNERLEFLGDAVLEFVVSEILYSRFPGRDEGFLTNLRANIVNTKNLAKAAVRLEIGPSIKMSKGEIESGGQSNASLLADTMEAIIGAHYIDAGVTKTIEFIKESVLSDLDEKANEPLKDPKSLLQEKIQAMGLPTPYYKVVKEEGPDHAREFFIEVSSQGRILGEGQGKSKSEAQQEAAKVGLDVLASKD